MHNRFYTGADGGLFRPAAPASVSAESVPFARLIYEVSMIRRNL